LQRQTFTAWHAAKPLAATYSHKRCYEHPEDQNIRGEETLGAWECQELLLAQATNQRQQGNAEAEAGLARVQM